MSGALRTRQLGAAGAEITTIGFGAWGVGGTASQLGLGEVDDRESVAAVRAAIESGVNWIDTAPAYGAGHSEEVVGRAIEPYRAGVDVFVFTKCGISFEHGFELDSSPVAIRRGCEASLRRLGVERLDALQIHWLASAAAGDLEESWATLATLVDEGKVRWIGASNFDVALLERCEAIRHVDIAQPPLSLLRRGARDAIAPWCAQNGTAAIVYSPLATGLLTGAYDRRRVESLPDDDARARVWSDFREPRLGPALALVERLRPLAAGLGVTLTTLALAWALAVAGVSGAIVGGRRPDQIADWLAAGNLDLEPSLLAAIEELVRETGAGDDDPPATSL